MRRRLVARWAGGAILTGLVLFALAPFALHAASDAGVAPAKDAAAPPAPPSPTVKIVFTIVPSSKRAMVYWGRKRLGIIRPHAPLVVSRPRDSGPLDVVVRSDGFIPVQTRAYTFADTKVAVRLTKLEDKNTLLGYREELPPDGGVSPDGGIPLGAPAAGPDGAVP